MSELLRQPLSRRILSTAAIGSLADWTLFAALVAVVAGLSGGSVFAVALVTGARILPSILLGPLVAPRVGALGLRRALVGADLARAGAVSVVAAVALRPELGLVLLVPALLLLELAAALVAAARESAISGGVPPASFRALNTATGLLGYGMLPVGGAVAALVTRLHPAAPFLLVIAGYTVNALLMRGAAGLREAAPAGTRVRASAGFRAVAAPGALRDTLLTAVVGLLAIVMLFSVGTAVAARMFGGAEDYGLLLALLGAGAAGGIVAVQRHATVGGGLLAAAAGASLLAVAGPAGMLGVALIGWGAAVAYVATQSRIQQLAHRPEEFAAAFALLKLGSLVALLTAPLLHSAGGMAAVHAGIAATAWLGLVLHARLAERIGVAGLLFTTLARPVLRRALRVSVDGAVPKGAAVVVSNHPSALDGPLAVMLDPRIRPIAKPQRHPLARLGFALSGTIVRGRGSAVDAGVGHLRRGGMIWLAPEGGSFHGPLRAPRSGAAVLALEAGVPIVPMGIRYETERGPRLRRWRPWRRPEVRVVFGDAVALRPGDTPASAAARYMPALAACAGTVYAPAQAVQAARVDREAV